jgi:lysophospholipase L1-like esterase
MLIGQLTTALKGDMTMTKPCSVSVAFLLAVSAYAATAPDGEIVADFESAASAQLKIQETAPGSIVPQVVADPKGGHFLSLKFERSRKTGHAYASLPIVAELAKSAGGFDGITFRVKGDGAKTFGTIELRADDFVNIYQAVFPLDSKEWRDVSIRWDEFFQMNDGVKQAPINWPALNVFAFGSRADWGSARFDVDDLRLAKIPAKKPLVAPAGADKLSRTVEKLKSGKPVRIVALGDSITFGTKVDQEKRATALYFEVAAAELRKAFPSATITTVNAGVGGDTIGEGIVRIGHQVAAQAPDLVIVLLGANDALYEFPESRVRATMGILMEKLLETTSADVLILGPLVAPKVPTFPERYSPVYAALAMERNVAFFDLGKATGALPKKQFESIFDDGVHPNEEGHAICGKALGDYLLGLAKAGAK